MKFLYSTFSPYARKVLILACETGQIDDLELVIAGGSPVARNAQNVQSNPIGKVPVLIPDDGPALFDSRVICQYLDARHTGAKFYPKAGDDLWPVLRHEALSDGIMDAALLARFETAVRPKEFYWGEWYDGQMLKATTALDVLESEAETINDAAMGAIAIACALSYLDLRYPDLGWETAHPKLAAWYGAYSKRPAMIAADAVANPA